MLMRLQGKTAFITGASRNIGRAIALTFAADGADLVLNTRANRDELEAVAAECRKAGVRASLTGRPNTAAVTAAKTGLLGFVRALAAELGLFGIRANMVIPGTMDTERRYAEWYPEFRKAPPGAPEQLKQIPLGRLGRPEEIADACLFLASDASAYITGDEIRVMGGRIIG